MFGLGVGEILLILIVALLVFGPTKLPDMARTFGKAMAEFRRASKDLRETFEVEMHRMDEAAPARTRPAPKILEAELEPPAPSMAVSAPVTSAPVASAPVVSAPVVSAPVVSAPVASAPVVSAPVASAPAETVSQGSISDGTAAPLADGHG